MPCELKNAWNDTLFRPYAVGRVSHNGFPNGGDYATRFWRKCNAYHRFAVHVTVRFSRRAAALIQRAQDLDRAEGKPVNDAMTVKQAVERLREAGKLSKEDFL